MQLAFYKGPTSDLIHAFAHNAIKWWTESKYSHVELVLDGMCYSSSSRDKGVRRKQINLTDDKWDLVPVVGDADFVREFFEMTKGSGYDWAGVSRFVVPKLPNALSLWYCTEWSAAALQYPDIEFTPQSLYVYAKYLERRAQ